MLKLDLIKYFKGSIAMLMINIHDAKTHLFKLVDAAINGKETIITKAGKPVARLVPITGLKPQYKFGVLKDKVKIAKNFDAPLSDDYFADIEGL